MGELEPLVPRRQRRHLAVLVPGDDLAVGDLWLFDVVRVRLEVVLSLENVVDLVAIVGPTLRGIVRVARGRIGVVRTAAGGAHHGLGFGRGGERRAVLWTRWTCMQRGGSLRWCWSLNCRMGDDPLDRRELGRIMAENDRQRALQGRSRACLCGRCVAAHGFGGAT